MLASEHMLHMWLGIGAIRLQSVIAGSTPASGASMDGQTITWENGLMINPKVWTGSQARRISRIAARLDMVQMGHVGMAARQMVMGGHADHTLKDVGKYGTAWANPRTNEITTYTK